MTENVSLKVIHESGRIDTLSIVYPAFLGRGNVLNKLFCADGTEHFFTKEGYYDGYGRNMAVPNETGEDSSGGE